VLTVVVAQVAALLWLYPLWNVHAEPVTPFAAQFVTLFGLLRSGWRVGDPLQFGTMAFVLSALAIWALATGLLRRETPAYRLTLFALVTSLALFALTLPWSRLLWEATGAQNLLRSPVQVAILAAPFVAAACAGAVLALESLRRPALWASLVLLIVLSAAADLLPTYTTVAPAATPAATFGDNDLIVLNAAVSEQADPRQAQLTVTWQALRPLDFDANVFFQALGGEDAPTVVAQLDTAPVADAPSTTWQPGMIYTGVYTLDLPAESAGPMTYYFGLYDWRDGTRLPVNAGLDDKMLFHGQ
jgi:hypothetical protein